MELMASRGQTSWSVKRAHIRHVIATYIIYITDITNLTDITDKI